MTAANATPAQLTISTRANRPSPLYPEQAADFDLVLRNSSQQPLTVKALEGNLDTPVIRLFGSQGLIGEFDKRAMGARMVGDVSTLMQPSPNMVTLAPDGEDTTWVNLWSFHAALPPGAYAFDVVHDLNGSGLQLTSERMKFNVVPVHVSDVALGYDSRNRFQSLVAWLAGSEPTAKLRLLLRESGFAGHESLHQGATAIGEYEVGARVAVSQLAWDAQATPVSWLAVFSPDGTADLVEQAGTVPQGPVARVALGVRAPLPVPRFPNRGHAVVLATGASPKGPALAGAVVPEEGNPLPWLVPLTSTPQLSACAFTQTGGIEVLLVSDDGRQSTVRRLEVDENGKVLSPEQTLRTTPNAITALAVGQRSPQAFFLLLEADRIRHDHVAVLRIASTGETKTPDPELPQVKGWPSTRTAEEPQAQAARALTLEQAPDGGVWLAMTDVRGDLYCGRANGSLSLVRESKGSDLLFPQVAALRDRVSCFGFAADGQMFTSGTLSH